jgi:hypothetical protein
MPRAAACLLGLIVLAGVLACGSAPSEPRPAAQAALLPEPGLARERPAPPPFQLTSTDGVGLEIAAVRATTVIEDPLAFTELHLTFENPEARTLEGRFTFTIPPGASLSRFGMKINGRMMEGEVVEKQRARITYEEFLHQRKDPALLEQGAGNELAVRVFPILAHEKKEIVVSYSEVTSRRKPYRLHLQGLSKIAKLDAEVFAEGAQVALYRARDEVPAGDLVVPSSKWSTAESVGLSAGPRSVVRVRVPEGASDRDPLADTVILVDTSASRALDLSQEIATLKSVVGAMTPDAKLVVGCFDQSVALVYDGPASGFAEGHLDFIRKRGALGASNFTSAMAWARDAAGKARSPRLLVLSDGVVTSGPRDTSDLRSFAKGLADAGFARADAVVFGGIRETASLDAIVKGSMPRAGVVVSAEDGAVEVNRRLTSATLAPLAIKADGAQWLHPTVVEGTQPGDEIVVHVEAKTTLAALRVGPYEIAPLMREAGGPLVDRSIALAKIASIEESDAIEPDDKRSQIIALSTKHRVVSEHTAMLVLETEADYDRFSIDRNANVDVVAIESGRVELKAIPRGMLRWEMPTAPVAPTSPWGSGLGADALSARGNMWGDNIGDAFGAGGLGLTGIGEGGGGRSAGIGLGGVGTIGHGAGTGTGQGFGNGSGRMAGTHRTRPPSVRMGATHVSGRLPPEVVQRIVRQNFGRFRGCYEAELGHSANASGRVTTRFKIATDGSVKDVTDQGSEIASRPFRQCIQRAFAGLSFPIPEGGPVTVVYPLVFAPEGTAIATQDDALRMPRRTVPRREDMLRDNSEPLPAANADPYTGQFASVMERVRERDARGALSRAIAWRAEAPGEVLAYVALGEAAELAGDKALASRAYGSILELWSYRVDMLRLAGERLDRVGDPDSLELATETYRAAVLDRPDHPSSHRLHAMALLKLGRPAEAFEVLEGALKRSYADGRFVGVETILRDDLALAAAAWAAKAPEKRSIIETRLGTHDRTLDGAPSLRFVLVWETDASDVDLHVADRNGNHAYYGQPTLPSGGKLEADVTNGYGPEAFTIAEKAKGYPYTLRVRYYARGPMGFGMGKVQIVEHDGKGKLRFDERPFVLMKDQAVVDLGSVPPMGRGRG